MGQRVKLQEILESIPGVSKVYFQPPSNITLEYPCIIYSRSYGDTQFADNVPYLYGQRYDVTVIDRNPDSEIPMHVAMLPMCIFDRAFKADNLNHDAFKLYF